MMDFFWEYLPEILVVITILGIFGILLLLSILPQEVLTSLGTFVAIFLFAALVVILYVRAVSD